MKSDPRFVACPECGEDVTEAAAQRFVPLRAHEDYSERFDCVHCGKELLIAVRFDLTTERITPRARAAFDAADELDEKSRV